MNLIEFMKKFILSCILLGVLLFLTESSRAGNFSVSFGTFDTGWGYHSRPAYYYEDCAPAPAVVVYRTYPASYYYQRPYYQQPVYYQPYRSYGYSSAYRQGFRNGYATAVRRATPIYRAERCDRVYR